VLIASVMGGCSSKTDTTRISAGTCAICLGEVIVAETRSSPRGTRMTTDYNLDYVVMGCGNKFHRECISAHYQQDRENSKCPLCRSRYVMTDEGGIVECQTRIHTPVSDDLSAAIEKLFADKIRRGEL